MEHEPKPSEQDEIIEMAIQAELNLYVHDLTEKQYIEVIKHFAKLVAAKEREKFCWLLRQFHDSILLASDLNTIKARGET
jgi:hypothetical protein